MMQLLNRLRARPDAPEAGPDVPSAAPSLDGEQLAGIARQAGIGCAQPVLDGCARVPGPA